MKEFAIRENHLFVKAYQKGKKVVKKTIVVYLLPDYHAKRLKKENPEKKTLNRIGFSVSKKNGGAVTRNRCKRVMREAYRAVLRERKIKTGFLLVFVARDACATVKTEKVRADMTAAFAALELFVGTESRGFDRSGHDRTDTEPSHISHPTPKDRAEHGQQHNPQSPASVKPRHAGDQRSKSAGKQQKSAPARKASSDPHPK